MEFTNISELNQNIDLQTLKKNINEKKWITSRTVVLDESSNSILTIKFNEIIQHIGLTNEILAGLLSRGIANINNDLQIFNDYLDKIYMAQISKALIMNSTAVSLSSIKLALIFYNEAVPEKLLHDVTSPDLEGFENYIHYHQSMMPKNGLRLRSGVKQLKLRISYQDNIEIPDDLHDFNTTLWFSQDYPGLLHITDHIGKHIHLYKNFEHTRNYAINDLIRTWKALITLFSSLVDAGRVDRIIYAMIFQNAKVPNDMLNYNWTTAKVSQSMCPWTLTDLMSLDVSTVRSWFERQYPNLEISYINKVPIFKNIELLLQQYNVHYIRDRVYVLDEEMEFRYIQEGASGKLVIDIMPEGNPVENLQEYKSFAVKFIDDEIKSKIIVGRYLGNFSPFASDVNDEQYSEFNGNVDNLSTSNTRLNTKVKMEMEDGENKIEVLNPCLSNILIRVANGNDRLIFINATTIDNYSNNQEYVSLDTGVGNICDWKSVLTKVGDNVVIYNDVDFGVNSLVNRNVRFRNRIRDLLSPLDQEGYNIWKALVVVIQYPYPLLINSLVELCDEFGVNISAISLEAMGNWSPEVAFILGAEEAVDFQVNDVSTAAGMNQLTKAQHLKVVSLAKSPDEQIEGVLNLQIPAEKIYEVASVFCNLSSRVRVTRSSSSVEPSYNLQARVDGRKLRISRNRLYYSMLTNTKIMVANSATIDNSWRIRSTTIPNLMSRVYRYVLRQIVNPQLPVIDIGGRQYESIGLSDIGLSIYDYATVPIPGIGAEVFRRVIDIAEDIIFINAATKSTILVMNSIMMQPGYTMDQFILDVTALAGEVERYDCEVYFTIFTLPLGDGDSREQLENRYSLKYNDENNTVTIDRYPEAPCFGYEQIITALNEITNPLQTYWSKVVPNKFAFLNECEASGARLTRDQVGSSMYYANFMQPCFVLRK